MEAGAANGPAGGDGADAGQAADAPDLGQLVQDATAPLQQQLQDMRAFMESAPAFAEPAPGEQEQQPAEPDLSYLNPEAPEYDAERAGAELLRVIGQQQQQQVQPLEQQLQGLTAQLDEMRAQGEYRQLAEEFPDLNDRETADKVFDAASQWVGTLGLPQDQAEKLSQSPGVVRAVYMMGRAAELANEENSGQGPNAATLEGQGGASPQAPVQGALTAESIVKAGGRSPLPF